MSSLWVKTWSVFLSIYVLFPMRILKFLCSRKGKIHFTYDFAAQVKISKPIEYAIHWRRHGFTSNGPVSTSVALHSVIMIDMRAVFFFSLLSTVKCWLHETIPCCQQHEIVVGGFLVGCRFWWMAPNQCSTVSFFIGPEKNKTKQQHTFLQRKLRAQKRPASKVHNSSNAKFMRSVIRLYNCICAINTHIHTVAHS